MDHPLLHHQIEVDVAVTMATVRLLGASGITPVINNYYYELLEIYELTYV